MNNGVLKLKANIPSKMYLDPYFKETKKNEDENSAKAGHTEDLPTTKDVDEEKK